MLEPVVDGLVFLHQQGLVHGDIQPANIFAVGDTIKLSSDTVRPISGSSAASSLHLLADTRPSARGSVEPAGDIYSLGITIVQALTQRSPFDAGSSLGQAAEPLPAPFADIVVHALHPDVQLRWTAADIAARLNPAVSVAAAASASVSVPQRAAAKIEPPPGRTAPRSAPSTPPAGQRVAAGPPTAIPLSPVAPLPKKAGTGAPGTSFLLRYAAPIAVAIILLFMASRVFRRSSGSSASDSTIAKSAPATHNAETKASKPPAPPSQSTAAVPPAESRPDEHAAAQPPRAKVPAAELAAPTPTAVPEEKSPVLASDAGEKPEAAPATMRSATRTAASASAVSPDVLQQVLPDVSQKALSTIHGVVRLTIRAQVDAEGKVADAQLESPSGSSFFNDSALKAARKWQFQPSESADAHAYLLHFEFRPSGPRATAAPAR
jgi:TonB family protein